MLSGESTTSGGSVLEVETPARGEATLDRDSVLARETPASDAAASGGRVSRRGSLRGRGLRVAMIHISDFRLDSRIQRQARAFGGARR